MFSPQGGTDNLISPSLKVPVLGRLCHPPDVLELGGKASAFLCILHSLFKPLYHEAFSLFGDIAERSMHLRRLKTVLFTYNFPGCVFTYILCIQVLALKRKDDKEMLDHSKQMFPCKRKENTT